MEKDGHYRSESRKGRSAASCSHAEKRPLNNNILINASLLGSMATGSSRWRDYWVLGRGVTEPGPSWPQPSHLSLSASAVWRGWFRDLETLRLLRPSWSPPTIKAGEAGGPLTGNYHQKGKLTPLATWLTAYKLQHQQHHLILITCFSSSSLHFIFYAHSARHVQIFKKGHLMVFWFS